MSAPSQLHQSRVDVLTSAAVLAGYTSVVRLHSRMAPDVVLFHRPLHSLFIGDAKATERPTCRATRDRLLNYAEGSVPWLRTGTSVFLAIAHPHPDGVGWSGCLDELPRLAGLHVSHPSTALLDETTLISSVQLHLPDERNLPMRTARR